LGTQLYGINFLDGWSYYRLVFNNQIGQNSFRVGFWINGNNRYSMYIRKGGLPTSKYYDAYVNSTNATNPQTNTLFYDSGQTTIDDGTPWFIG
jgi:hypothetical protein